jgi:hypothetical protein
MSVPPWSLPSGSRAHSSVADDCLCNECLCNELPNALIEKINPRRAVADISTTEVDCAASKRRVGWRLSLKFGDLDRTIAPSASISNMYKIYFDSNEGTADGRYGLWLSKSLEDLAKIPEGPKEGMIVTIYMIGEIEAEATLEWCDDPWNAWTARVIEGTMRLMWD